MQQGGDEIFCRLGDLNGVGVAVLVLLDLLVRFLHVVGLKGGLAHDEGVQDNADGPDVNLEAVAVLVCQDFRGNVVGGATHGSEREQEGT